MAVRHQLIRRPPRALWDVLGDESRYHEWVVGTHSSYPAEGAWPQEGSSLRYTVRFGPKEFTGRTVVRRHDPPHVLELEAHSGALGSARIAFDIRPWGEHTLVVLDEHPLRGPGAAVHNGVVDALMQLRHRRMLARLAEVVERTTSEQGPRRRPERGRDSADV
ncbi:SRPBCC family protein [Streptomyces sp. NPDC060194]|uniref:SRPBCC family protein n=1 Tax=Streptomyces sp. NPDC060194 TaxID=3347069 RepID=UPI003650C83D